MYVTLFRKHKRMDSHFQEARVDIHLPILTLTKTLAIV